MTDVLDSLDLWGATLGLPEQLEHALASWEPLPGLPAHDDVTDVTILGMGGSGLAGDVAMATAGPLMAVPLVVHKGYGVPNFVGTGSLVLSVSFSGGTEETVEAAELAAAAGAHLVCVSTGGDLADLAERHGATHVRLPDGIPMPRAGIGATTVPVLCALDQVGLFPGAAAWITAAVDQLRRRRDQLTGEDSVARALARRIGGTMPLIYGGGHLGHVAALRWKNQCNENPKIPAWIHTYPELCHNEIAGWAQHGDVTRQVLHLVNLRHDFEHPQVQRRIDWVSELMLEVVGGVDEVVAEGDGALAQLFDLMFVGDLVSLELAAQAGVDPGPIDVLFALKAALAE